MIVENEKLTKLTTPIQYGWIEKPIEDYHFDRNAVNFSALKHMDKSEHAFARVYWGLQRPATARMKFGSLAHMAILEGSKFKARYVVMPEFESKTADGKISNSKNTSYYKDQVKRWTDEQPKDAIIVSDEEREKIFRMLDSVLSNKKASKLLMSGVPEAVGYWKDPITGINMRMAADFISFDLGILVDLKTCQDVRWEYFRKSVESYRYDLQMMFYSEGIKNITGKEPQSRAWITIESEEPHEVRIHEVGAHYETIGSFEYRKSLDKLKRAIDNKSFPQSNDEILVGEPSHWFLRKYLQMGVIANDQ